MFKQRETKLMRKTCMERLGTKKINVRSTSQEWREVGWDGKKKGEGRVKIF